MKNTKNFGNSILGYQPEVGLLGLASRGTEMNLYPTIDDFRLIVENLKQKKMVVLFKWFWKHSDVVRFAEDFVMEVGAENLDWYLHELTKITANRKSLHWLERINLFHTYGLSRLIDKDSGAKIMRSFPFFAKGTKRIASLSDLSACNVSLMLRKADSVESLGLLDSFSDRSLLAEYGLYQIYYYGGISELIDTLGQYVCSPKEVIIPQTIAGLFEAEPRSLLLSDSVRDRIYDEVLRVMPRKVLHTIEKMDKHHELSLKNKR